MIISEDKKTINLPVPLGTIVYGINTDCNDACAFQKIEFKNAFPESHCDISSPCHVILRGTYPLELNLKTLHTIIPNWEKYFFKTEKEAIAAGEKLVEQHIELMLSKNIGI